MRRPGDAVPGREPKSHVLADRADPPGGDDLASGVRGRRGRQHALAVRVEVRPEPGAPIVVRVRKHATRSQLAHGSPARRRGHESIRAAHQAVAAVEHERAREPRVGEAHGVDRLQAPATREHLVRARHTGQALEAAHLGAVRERVEPVVAVSDAQARDGRVDVDLLRGRRSGLWFGLVDRRRNARRRRPKQA